MLLRDQCNRRRGNSCVDKSGELRHGVPTYIYKRDGCAQTMFVAIWQRKEEREKEYQKEGMSNRIHVNGKGLVIPNTIVTKMMTRKK